MYRIALALVFVLAACGGTEQKFPCKAGEVLTAVGVCTTPGALVPAAKKCAQGELEQTDGSCVAPAAPWEFPCAAGDVLHENGTCTPAFSCASNEVEHADGTCSAPTDDEIAQIAATSRVYAVVDPSVTQSVVDVPDLPNAEWVGFNTFKFHAVGEAFTITQIAVGWGGYGSVDGVTQHWADWVDGYNIQYAAEGGRSIGAYYKSAPGNFPVPMQLFVPKDGDATLWVNFSHTSAAAACTGRNPGQRLGAALDVGQLVAVGMVTGKRYSITKASDENDAVFGNVLFDCGAVQQ